MFGTIKMEKFKIGSRYLDPAKFSEIVKSLGNYEYLANNITFDLSSRYPITHDELVEWFEDWLEKSGESFKSFWTANTVIDTNTNGYYTAHRGKLTVICFSEEDLISIKSILVKDTLSGELK